MLFVTVGTFLSIQTRVGLAVVLASRRSLWDKSCLVNVSSHYAQSVLVDQPWDAVDLPEYADGIVRFAT
jgi:hypothetical protein